MMPIEDYLALADPWHQCAYCASMCPRRKVFCSHACRRAARRKPKAAKAGYIYFIALADDLSAVKLGHTANLRMRLSALQTANSKPLQILAYYRVPDAVAAEQAELRRWRHLRLGDRTEWHALGPDLRQYIIELQHAQPHENQVL
jgi:predicted nucleic acid-binding Zn ribbon protein